MMMLASVYCSSHNTGNVIPGKQIATTSYKKIKKVGRR